MEDMGGAWVSGFSLESGRMIGVGHRSRVLESACMKLRQQTTHRVKTRVPSMLARSAHTPQ